MVSFVYGAHEVITDLAGNFLLKMIRSNVIMEYFGKFLIRQFFEVEEYFDFI